MRQVNYVNRRKRSEEAKGRDKRKERTKELGQSEMQYKIDWGKQNDCAGKKNENIAKSAKLDAVEEEEEGEMDKG